MDSLIALFELEEEEFDAVFSRRVGGVVVPVKYGLALPELQRGILRRGVLDRKAREAIA